MYGWTGKILEVDLSGGRVWRENIPEETLVGYLGGRGLGVRLLQDSFALDPFDPGMAIVFAAGPLTGTAAPTSARMAIVSRSPLTKTVFDASCGGTFAVRLKNCGVDAIRIRGASTSPVLLAIREGEAELVPAQGVWGKGINETMALLSPMGSVAAIGSAGENGVLFASIVTDDGDCQVRGGLGAVMGRKGLKGVVVAGNREIRVADGGLFADATRDVMRLFRASPFICGEFGLGRFGSPALVDLINQRRMTPTENFRSTYFPGAKNYSGPALRRSYNPSDDGCCGCPVSCLKSLTSGGALPSFDRLSHLGALNLNSDPDLLVRADSMCRDLGLDTVSAAATIAAWGEWRGSFAHGDELLGLLADVAHRRGDGELLALGSRRAMDELGAPSLSMSVKSLELPPYDPRGAYGLALAYCTSNRGGCHLAAFPISHEIIRKPVASDRFTFSGKAMMNKVAEDAIAVLDSMALCRFSLLGAGLEEFSPLLTAATGMEYTPGRLQMIGERIFMTERYYNSVNGFTVSDDCLPRRFFTEEGSGGDGIALPPLDRERFDSELGKYYGIRGLSPDGTAAAEGFPSGE